MWSGGWGGVGREGGKEDRRRGHSRQRAQQLQRPGAAACLVCLKNSKAGSSLVVQQQRICASSVRGGGSTPGRGTRSHLPQLKTPQVTTTQQRKNKKNSKVSRAYPVPSSGQSQNTPLCPACLLVLSWGLRDKF